MAVHATAPFAVTGHVVTSDGDTDAVVVVEDGRVAELRRGGRAPSGMPVLTAPLVSPGLIDLQVNGAFGRRVEEGADAVRAIAARLPSTGVTAWVPTLVSLPQARYATILRELTQAPSVRLDAGDQGQRSPGAHVLGVHVEGPLLAPTRVGAHDPQAVLDASAALYATMEPPLVATVAPECPGATSVIEQLAAKGTLVALGHTDADYASFVRGIDAGARLVTHLWNAMRGVEHRDPGAAGAALDDVRVTCSIIVDALHVHPAAVRLAWHAKGPRGLVLVTDAIEAAGMPAGQYRLGGRQVVSDGESARVADGRLAGSLLTMDAAVRNFVRITGVDAPTAIRCASDTPARLLGLTHKGRIEAGCDADLVLWSDDLRVQATIVGGHLGFRRHGS